MQLAIEVDFHLEGGAGSEQMDREGVVGIMAMPEIMAEAISITGLILLTGAPVGAHSPVVVAMEDIRGLITWGATVPA